MSENFGSNFYHQIEKNDEHFFDKIVYHKKHTGKGKNYMPINNNKLKYFENKVYGMWWFTRWWCDYRTLSNFQTQWIRLAQCFKIYNTTNSNLIRIDCSDINELPNYHTDIILKDDEEEYDIPDYNFDSVSYNILPDNFAQILITRNDTWKSFDEYFIDITEMWWRNYRLFRVQFYWNTNKDSRCAEIQVYWTCCRLESIYKEFNWYKFLQRLFIRHCTDDNQKAIILNWLDTFYYTRYDFRIDFFIPDEKVKPLKADDIFTKKKDTEEYSVSDDVSSLTKKEYFNRKWVYTGWSAGIRSNKYIFARQYHKKIDIIRNWDEELYADYHLYDGIIRRLEFEFGYRFLTSRGKIYITNWDDTLLTMMINEYLWVSLQTGAFSKKYEKVPEIPFDMLDSNKRNRQLSYMATVWDRVYKSWWDVLSTLIHCMSNKFHYDEKDIDNIIKKFNPKNISLPPNKLNFDNEKDNFDIDNIEI